MALYILRKMTYSAWKNACKETKQIQIALKEKWYLFCVLVLERYHNLAEGCEERWSDCKQQQGSIVTVTTLVTTL